jgi:hypothetical protein
MKAEPPDLPGSVLVRDPLAIPVSLRPSGGRPPGRFTLTALAEIQIDNLSGGTHR